MKKYLPIILALCLASTTLVFGATKSYTIYIDSKVVQMDTQPELYRNSTFVPVSFIAKELGFSVNWQSPKVTIQNKDTTLVLEVGSNAYTMNGKTYYTQYQPYVSNGRTYVPLRFISNAFGYPVNYTADTVGNGSIKIDTTKTVTSTNTFVDDNSTFTLSPNKKYGYKVESFVYNYATGGLNQARVTYFKNMDTGEFKELAFTSRHHKAYWTNDNRLVLGGEKTPTKGDNFSPNFTIYDPVTETLTPLADAYFGRYIDNKNLFIYETTVYNSDSTNDSNSSFYSKDLTTGKVTKITREQYEKYNEEEDKYQIATFGKTVS